MAVTREERSQGSAAVIILFAPREEGGVYTEESGQYEILFRGSPLRRTFAIRTGGDVEVRIESKRERHCSLSF